MTLVFYTLNSVFSNFHATEVKIEGQTYSCNDQYFQYAKALLFGNNETAANILQETDPYKINSLGKKAKGDRKQVWNEKAFDVLKHVNKVKYSQNPDAKAALRNTDQRKIGEASPDVRFGAGVSSSFATDETNWTGKNMMGKILTDIRTELKEA